MKIKFRKSSNILTLCCLGIMMFSPGCGTPAPLAQIRDAHQKLLTILEEENNLNVITKEFDNTLWIYLPSDNSFLEMKSKNEPAPPPSSSPSSSTTIYFLESEFDGRDFGIQYDIGPSKRYAKDPGYTSAFSEEYQMNQRSILGAISRAYSDFEEIPDDDQMADRAPNIFVIVMADIKNGVESRVFLHLKDLKRAYTDPTFHVEYAKRVISDQPSGNPAIIGDETGKHINFRDIQLPEFLAKQIVFRINFKYTRSAFPPKGMPKEEILKTVVETVDAYDFQEFTSVKLRDLNDGAVYSTTKDQLSEYRSKPSEGRLIHIKFR